MRNKDNDIDQGYAWVVLAAAFCIQMIAGILTYSPGVTNIAILEEIENDLTKTSWIGSALFGTFTLLGPVAGILQNRIGPRITAIAGGILALIGLTAASFCQTVVGLIMTYGLLTGFGICLAGNLVGVVPGQYFVKRRPVAYGMCMAGGAMGLFISGPLTRYLLAEYGISGTLLLLGAVSFHICITGVIFREKGPVRSHSLTVVEGEDASNEASSFIPLETEGKTISSNELINQDIEGRAESQAVSLKLCSEKEKPRSSLLSNKDIPIVKQTGSPTDYQEPVETPLVDGGIENKRPTKYKYAKKRIPNMVPFIFYNVSVGLWSLGESACMFHLPNYAQMKGSSLTQAASLFTAIGTGGLISRTVTGMIASDSKIGYTTLHVGFVGIAGTITLLFPLFSYKYSLQLAYSMLYGIYNQGVNSLMAPITIDLIGLSNVAIGFGVVYFSSGIGYFLGPPIASALFKLTGSYDFTFIFTGICLILSSITTAASSIFRKE